MSPVNVVAIGAHPDDIELGCGGTLRLLADQGYRVGVIDLTEGELGSRGSVELRREEAAAASTILGVSERTNLGIPDGQIENTKDNQLKIVRAVRELRPDIVLIGAPECRHPDHIDATRLCLSALFYSGLRMVDKRGEAWRPSHILHYMQALTFEPTFVVDVSSTWQRRMEAVLAYKSQFHNPDYQPAGDEPDTYISNPGFLGFVEARARMLGYRIGADFGEGLLYHQSPFGIDDLVETLQKRRRT